MVLQLSGLGSTDRLRKHELEGQGEEGEPLGAVSMAGYGGGGAAAWGHWGMLRWEDGEKDVVLSDLSCCF